MKHEYSVVYQTIDDGWVMATVPELPGAVFQAPTLEEARDGIKAIVAEVLFTYRENARVDPPRTPSGNRCR